MTAFPSLGISDMDIVQALLCVLIALAWEIFTILRLSAKELRSSGEKLGGGISLQLEELTSLLEELTSLLETKFDNLTSEVESVQTLIEEMGSGRAASWHPSNSVQSGLAEVDRRVAESAHSDHATGERA